MGLLQRSRYCKNCERKTLHSRHTFSGGMGCLLTVITGGLFLPVWIIIWFLQSLSPMRCQACGRGKHL